MKKKKGGCLPIILILIVLGAIGSIFDRGDSTKETTVRATPAISTTAVASSPKPTPTPTSEPEKTDDLTSPPAGSFLELLFIDVDQGDASLVICDGHAMLIDGGTSNQSSKIYTILKDRNITHLDYIVASHEHSDHVGGLSGALNYATVSTALSPVDSGDNEAFKDFLNYLGKQGVSITIPHPGDKFTLGSASFEICGPINHSSEPNNNSIVLRLDYGSFSALFTGDAERPEEQDILGTNHRIKSTVLKVGHHGSSDSTGYQWLYEVEPEIAVISCGTNNIYGFPTEETLSRLRDSGTTVLRTDIQGDIDITVAPNGTYGFLTARNLDADTLVPGGTSSSTPVPAQATPQPNDTSSGTDRAVGTTYILNTNTGKFHYPSCSSVNQMNDSNKQEFTGTRDEAISMGYSPCGRCHP